MADVSHGTIARDKWPASGENGTNELKESDMQTIISSIKQTLRLRFGLFRNTANKPLQYIRVLPKSGAL